MLRDFLRNLPIRPFATKVALCGVFAIATLAVVLAAVPVPSVSAVSTVPTKINFQGRLTTAAGAPVADGLYNMKFALYDAVSGGTLKWSETRETTNRVQVTGGLFSTKLGDVTPMDPTIFANGVTTPLYFEITLANPATATCSTASCQTWEGAMNRNQVATSAYAYNSDLLDGLDSSAFAAATGSTGYIQNQSAGQQATSNFWMSGTGRADTALQAPTFDTATSTTLNIGTTNATGVSIGKTASNITTTITGTAIIKPSAGNDSATAFQIQNASGASLLRADTLNSRIGINVTYSSMSIPIGLVASAPTSGGSLVASTTYFYKVTAIDSVGGETTPSSEVSQTTDVTNKTVPLTWTAVTGATGYRVYRSTTTNTEVYLTTVYKNTYTDAGSHEIGTSTPASLNTAVVSTNGINSSAQLAIGGNGKPTGQLYVSGIVPTSAIGRVGYAGSSIYPVDVQVQGKYAYVAVYPNNSGLILIYDISNPASPISVGSLGFGNWMSPTSIYVSGKYAYLTISNGMNFIQIVDISNPANPTLVSSTATASNSGPNDIFVQGRYAYVTNDNGTIKIYDINNPASPVAVGTVNTGGYPREIKVQGKYAYVTNYNSNTLQIFDVSNPSNPVSTGSIATGTNPYGIYVSGGYAYVTNYNSNTLQIFDVSNPSNPVSTGSIAAGEHPKAVFVQQKYAYVTTHNAASGTVGVFDISNPSAPASVGTVPTEGWSHAIFVAGRYAYVANKEKESLQIFDMGGTYTQQLEAGGIEAGTLGVNGNASISGDASVVGGLNVAASIQTSGSIAVQQGATVNGSVILGGGLNTLNAPATPTITPQGTTGATSYSYTITAVNSSGGETVASTAGSTATGSATLSATDFNRITWGSVGGASSYKIYRTASGGTPSSTGFIASTNVTTFDDTGLFANGASSTRNTTSQLTVQGSAMFRNDSDTTAAVQVQNATGANIFAVDTTNGEIELGAPTLAGKLVISDGSSNNVTLSVGALAGDFTLGIPTMTANDTLCLVTAANCANGTMFVQNQNASDQIANFRINGSGQLGSTLKVTGLTTLQGGVTSPGGTNSERFGVGSAASGTDAVALGYNATASTGSVVIGSGASDASSWGGGVVIGYQAATTDPTYQGIAIGRTANAGRDGLALGKASSSGRESISIGNSAATDTGGISLGNNASTASYNVAIGHGATANGAGGGATAIGNSSYADMEGTAVGQSASSGRSNVAIGNSAVAAYWQGVAVGNSANTTHVSSIALGAGATTTANNQLVINGVNQGYFGNGVTNTSPSSFTLNATGGSGTDIQGGNVTFAGGRGTGSAAGGSIKFQTSAGGSTGTTLGNLVDVLTLNGGTGAASFRNISNSTTAFQVQNASAASVFTIDTTNARLSIGPVAGNTVGTLLVLGNKTNEGDPTGVEGAMYYNSSMKSFRCYRDSDWRDCGVRNIEREWLVEDEFMSGSSRLGAGADEFDVSSLQWKGTKLGAGTWGLAFNTSAVAQAQDTQGTLEIYADTSTNTGGALTLDGGNGGSLSGSGASTMAGMTFKATAGLTTVTDHIAMLGMANNLDSTTLATRPTGGVWWESNPAADANTDSWWYCVGNGSVQTFAQQCTDSNVAVTAQAWMRLEIRVTAQNAATFCINGNCGFTKSGTTIATDGGNAPGVRFYSTNATSKSLALDYVQVHGTTSTAR